MELTFGEQIKILLNRRGMSIKELAELTEEKTGKSMSRQNLTQRLNRDNFQEQDMRVLAEILGCRVRIIVEPDDTMENGSAAEAALTPKRPVKTREKKKEIIKKQQEPEEILGDVDPETGKEYLTNTVRQHKSIPGYIQVYDRSEHRWVDVEERNFMEFQESKRAVLGRDYVPPVYLDYL